MPRYIDADEFVKRVIQYQRQSTKTIGLALADTPTADVVEVRHGKWIIRDNPGTEWYRVICSECGEDVTSEIPVIGFFPDAKPIWDFCPYCGADMRKETEDE